MKNRFRVFFVLLCLLSVICTSTANAANRVVKVGYFSMPGYQEIDDIGNMRGYGYEFLEKIRRYSDWDYQYVYFPNGYQSAMEALEDGRVDIITSTTMTPERLQKLAFSNNPVCTSSAIIPARKNDIRFWSGDTAAYAGKTIGMLAGNSRNRSFAEYAANNGFDYIPVYYNNVEELEQALQTGAVDLIVSSNLRVINDENILKTFDAKENFLVTRKEDTELMQEANRAMSMLSADVPNWQQDLWQEYYSIGKVSRMYLTPANKVYLDILRASGKVLKVLVSYGHAPFAYNEKDSMQGTNVEYFRAIADNLGLKYEFITINSVEEYIKILDNGEADIVVGSPMDYNVADKLGYVLTEPFAFLPVAMVHKGNASTVHKVAMNRFSILDRIMKKHNTAYEHTVVYYNSAQECVEAIVNNKCDGALINLYEAQLLANKYRGGLTVTPLIGSLPLSIAVRGDLDRNLVTVLDKAISSDNSFEVLLHKEIRKLSGNWSIEEMVSDHPMMTVAFFCLAVMAVLGLAYSQHKNKMAAMVLLKNKALHEINEELTASYEQQQAQNEELNALYEQQQAQNEELNALYEQQQAQNEELVAMNDTLNAKDKEIVAISEAKTNFLFNMSHDIRTPMNAIIGFTGLMGKHLDQPEKLQSYINKIKSSSDYLLDLINNVLDMARIESGKVLVDESYFDIVKDGGEVPTVFESLAAEKNLSISYEFNVKHRYIYCDHLKLKQICLNLISNAVKYTPAGGSIKIKVEELPYPKDGWSMFQSSVEDTGIGMDPEYLPHIFEPFTRERNTTKSKIIGTGLGMPIVKKLVDLLGGTITIESELGRGTKIVVSVPHRFADETEIAQEESQQTELNTTILDGLKILLAEDNDMNAEIAIEVLSGYGAQLDRAEDGIICVDMLEKAAADQYDLVLMDVQMPNMDGYKATSIIRRFTDPVKANIPIVAMTANAFDEDKRHAMEAGMNGHLGKPIKLKEIFQVLGKVLNSRTTSS